VRVHPAQVRQLLQLALHRRRRRRGRPGPQPGQPGTAQQRVGHQHPVQLATQEAGQHRLHPLPRLPAGPLPGGRDALQDVHHARPDEPRRRQVLARQPEQQLRRVVLQRPREQELLQVLPPRPVDLVPAQVRGHLAQVARSGLLAGTVATQLADRGAQPLRQPRHRSGRGGRHVVRDEPQPRQRAQLHGSAQHVLPVPEPADELLIGRREHEKPNQLGPADLGEPPQLRELVRREHVPGRHRRTFPRRPNPDGEHLSDTGRYVQQNRLIQPHPARRYLAVMPNVVFRWMIRPGPGTHAFWRRGSASSAWAR
jgi:hypothetical protein